MPSIMQSLQIWPASACKPNAVPYGIPPGLDRLARVIAKALRVPFAAIAPKGFHAVSCQTNRGSHDERIARAVVDVETSMKPLNLDLPARHGGKVASFSGVPIFDDCRTFLGVLYVVGDTPLAGAEPAQAELMASFADIVAERFVAHRVGSARRQALARFQHVAATASDGIVCTNDHGHITYANAAAGQIFGYKSNELAGKHIGVLLPAVVRDNHQPVINSDYFDEDNVPSREPIETEGVRADGGAFPAELLLSTWEEDTHRAFAFMVRDVSTRKRNDEHLFNLAHFDPLTGLPNRQTFRVIMDEYVAAEREFGLLLLDLDAFKDVNDAHGHHAGDDVLIEISARLLAAFPDVPVVARLGGDEFAVIVVDEIDGDALRALGNNAIRQLMAPVSTEHAQVRVGASIGISIHPSHGADGPTLLANADLALYKAKGRGPGRVECFTDPLRAALVARRDLEDQLHAAWRNNEFELFYQPQFNMTDERLIGAEALLRWRHPERGLLTPVAFLAVLESSSLVGPVGEWVLQEACRQARAWRTHIPGDFRIAVNLFAAQVLGDDLERQVLAALNAADIPACALELEITENTVLAQNDALNTMWRRLVDAGVSLAFDDYGTGYAALNLLKSLPISRLKIDRTFVSDVVSNREDAAVVQAIVYLGKNFGMRVVAEGVETREQARMLRALQCSEVQGYLYSPPISGDEFAERFLDTVHAKARHI